MTWQILLVLAIFLSSIATLLQKIIMRNDESDPVATSIFYQLMMIVVIGLFTILSGNFIFTGIEKIIPNIVIMTILISCFYFFLFSSLQKVDASEYIIISSARPLFTIFASSIILSEGLNQKQFLGVIIILVAIAIVTMQKTKFIFKRGELFALLAAIAIGFANTNDRYILLNFPLIPYMFLSALLPGIFLMVINVKTLPKIKIFFHKEIFLKMCIMALFQLATGVTFLKAFQIGENSSQISSLFESNIILTVMLGIIFLKETDNLKRKIIGSIIAFLGIILIG